MGHTNSHELARRLPIAALLAIPLLAFQASVFAGDATEPERLAVLMRQLDMLDRLAEHSERLPKQDASATTSTTRGCARTSSVSAAASVTT